MNADVIADVLADHWYLPERPSSTRHCVCRWRANLRTDRKVWAIADQHRRHVADVLAERLGLSDA